MYWVSQLPRCFSLYTGQDTAGGAGTHTGRQERDNGHTDHSQTVVLTTMYHQRTHAHDRGQPNPEPTDPLAAAADSIFSFVSGQYTSSQQFFPSYPVNTRQVNM